MSNTRANIVPPPSMELVQSPFGPGFPPAPRHDWYTNPPTNPNHYDWFWPSDKRVLMVSFLNGTSEERNNVMDVINENYNMIKMGIRFKFIQDNDSTPSDIRVMFTDVSKSTDGYLAAGIPLNKPTLWLNLGWGGKERRQSAILHEFGHALGLKHAHCHPDSNINWNFKVINERYGLGYERFVGDFAKISVGISALMPYDRNSIMHYSVLRGDTHSMITCVDSPTVLSKGNKKFLMAIYPLDGSDRTLEGVTERMRKPTSELLRGKKRPDLRSAARRDLGHSSEKVDLSNNPPVESETKYLNDPFTNSQTENPAMVFLQTILPRGYRGIIIFIAVLYCAIIVLIGFALLH